MIGGVRISKLIKFRCYWDSSSRKCYMELYVLYFVDVVVASVFIYLEFSDKYNNEVKTNPSSKFMKKKIYFCYFSFHLSMFWMALFVLCQIIDKLLVIIYLSIIFKLLFKQSMKFSSAIQTSFIHNIHKTHNKHKYKLNFVSEFLHLSYNLLWKMYDLQTL